MRLSGKRVLVTAAGQGIGRATAEAFCAEGADVLATDIDVRGLGTLRCDAVQLDVTDAQAISAVIRQHGPFDTLFNCAGWVHAGTILDCTEHDWARSLDVNVTSMYRTISAVLPGMLAKGAGSIINMSSVASSIKGVPNRFAYSMTKAAVIGLTKAIAADFVSANIRCNAICPGTVDTPSLHERLHATGDYDVALESFIARQPMGRLARPEEIAHLAVYLASDESAFTTGACHVIDGAWSN